MTSGLHFGGDKAPGRRAAGNRNLSIGTNPKCDIQIDITREAPPGCAHVRDWSKLAN